MELSRKSGFTDFLEASLTLRTVSSTFLDTLIFFYGKEAGYFQVFLEILNKSWIVIAKIGNSNNGPITNVKAIKG